jgi:murein DD-endopeptidase MepM/ murein hydrolase activator NlpD
MKRSGSQYRIRGLFGIAPIIPAIACLIASVARADEARVDTVGSITPASDTVTIRVGRALDFEGRPIYAVRTQFSGSAEVTRLSLNRPRLAFEVPVGTFAPQSPLARARVTSGFGERIHPLLGGLRMHSGIDLAAPYGSPIMATSDGIVESAGWTGGYGLAVRLRHAGGIETLYGHMSALHVASGQAVRRGEVIGYVGSTGQSTGPHLHYEQRNGGVPVRPTM